MSQTDLANALGVTFQQVQKYEKGTNRISASRLQQIASVLAGANSLLLREAHRIPRGTVNTRWLADISKLTATHDGLSLIKAVMKIKDPKLRRCIVNLVEVVARTVDRRSAPSLMPHSTRTALTTAAPPTTEASLTV